MGPDAMIFIFWMLSFKTTCSLSSFTFIKRLLSSSSLSAIRLVSSAYLRLLIFLPAILIPACDSSSPAFLRNTKDPKCPTKSWERETELKESGSLASDYATKLQSWKQCSTGTKQKSRSMEQNKKPRSKAMHYDQLICDKGGKSIQWREDSLLNKLCWEDEPGVYYTEWSKPERKTPKQYTNAYIWNLERW